MLARVISFWVLVLLPLSINGFNARGECPISFFMFVQNLMYETTCQFVWRIRSRWRFVKGS